MESDRWRVAPGHKVDLTKIDPASTAGAPGDKVATKATFAATWRRLEAYQERLYAERKRSLLLVLQAMDAGGKDGTIKHVFRGINPAGTAVVSFKVPSEEELAHDFLWRIHRRTPGRGDVVVFNRSHYEDVLIVRVHNLVPETVWRPRYKLIAGFEDNLVAAGTHVVKLYLHISREEQARRFRDRLQGPTKRWKFRRGDLDERKLWDVYLEAYKEAIERTSAEHAPWYIVPADRKWYRNWAVGQILLDTFEQIDPQYPPGEDLSDVVIG